MICLSQSVIHRNSHTLKRILSQLCPITFVKKKNKLRNISFNISFVTNIHYKKKKLKFLIHLSIKVKKSSFTCQIDNSLTDAGHIIQAAVFRNVLPGSRQECFCSCGSGDSLRWDYISDTSIPCVEVIVLLTSLFTLTEWSHSRVQMTEVHRVCRATYRENST